MPSRLKTLELHGYKTFAARTEFTFAEMITAIVGPNGSGKSNIADAIRWVLGEQSFSLLRAKKSEDMIFSGSEQKSRSGMASASIVFDNSDGWLPIDFVDVAITRRAYRDGQNEYLINGQKVRLRDVSELLSQSGLAERTYTIIGQGLVDAALALRAEERRRLFEEAAGIGLHRSRKEEALRRLDSTRRNLERVQDILAELQPRLRSLERQSKRVREYEQVKAELQSVLRDWYGYHWHRMQKELADAQLIAHNQEQNLDRVRVHQEELNGEMVVLVDKISTQREQLGLWHRELSSLHTRQEQLSRDLVVAEERIRSFTIQKNDINSEISRLTEESTVQDDYIHSADSQIESLGKELNEAVEKVHEYQNLFQEKQVLRSQTEAKVQEARQALSTLTTRRENIGTRIDERNANVERNKLLLIEVQNEVSKLAIHKEQAEQRHQEAQETLLKDDKEYLGIQDTVNQIRTELNHLDNDRKQQTDKISDVKTDIARYTAQLKVLDQAERSLTGYTSGARVLLQAVQQSRLTGVHGAISSSIEVPEKYELAIASALGEYLDAVLFDNAENIEDALKLLEGTQVRSALLPLEIHEWKSKINNDLDLDEMGGVVGFASDLIEVPQMLQRLVQFLLSEVVVVENREVARKLVEKLRDIDLSNIKIVTLRGELFHISGGILAGQEGKPGSLSRPRERRILQTRLSKQQEAEAVLQKSLTKFNADIEIRQTQLKTAEENSRRIRNQVEKSRERVAQEGLLLQKADQDYRFQQDRITRLDKEIESGLNEIKQFGGEIGILEEEIKQARQQLRSQLSSFAESSLDEIQNQLTHWRTRQAVANRALSDAKQRKQELQSGLVRTEEAQNLLRSRIVELDHGLQELTNEKEKAILQEVKVSQEINLLQEKIQPAEQTLSGLEKNYENLQKRETLSRQTLSNAEHQHAQARISLARRQETVSTLKSRIEDDFGLVSFQYADNISGQTTLPLDGLVEQLPVIVEIPAELEENVKRNRTKLRRIGPVNQEVQEEYEQVRDRYEFLTEQVSDLRKAEADIKEVTAELDLLMEREFGKTFNAVAQEFRQIFTRLFGGGSARLVLTSPENMADTGIDIEARLPGRREQGLSLLSGGERSLTAAALVFSLLRVSPTPFCVLDEVDAMLDEANVGRFRDLLRELSQSTQFVVVTHNRNTVQAADVIYGVTMGQDSASRVISLKLDEVNQVVDN